ncbi:uncharacterized protein LOC106013752 [Aplysia californica]|uniref:Uncharacterized protein LOC106013752 n=1 Tax=Aplysia californica TaxID=6500 RepID=A0ABM1ADT1_APLCA|nr:uncharacterized protein LOC106013752 [Aplysia californica]
MKFQVLLVLMALTSVALVSGERFSSLKNQIKQLREDVRGLHEDLEECTAELQARLDELGTTAAGQDAATTASAEIVTDVTDPTDSGGQSGMDGSQLSRSQLRKMRNVLLHAKNNLTGDVNDCEAMLDSLDD